MTATTNRSILFNVTSEVVFLSYGEFSRYWESVDNAWIQRNKSYSNKFGDITKSFKCRLAYYHRDRDKTDACLENHLTKRHKPVRKPIACDASIRILFKHDGMVVISPFSLNFQLNTHTHDLGTVDQIKLCTYLRRYLENEVIKGYTPVAIHEVLTKSDYFQMFGSHYLTLKQVHNVMSSLRSSQTTVSATSRIVTLEDDLKSSMRYLLIKSGYMLAQSIRAQDQLAAFVFMNKSMKSSLAEYGSLVEMDATYRTNRYGWSLFTIYIRDHCGNWLPGGHFLCKIEKSILIARCLQVIKEFCSEWVPRYFIMDNDVSEKAAVSLAFPNARVETFDCTVHTLRSWNRRIGPNNKLARRL